jgi:hypothetical protein
MAAVPAPPIPTPSPEAAPLSQGARIVNTFVAPSKTFNDLRRSAAWWAPYLMITVAWIGFVYVVESKIGYRTVQENKIRMVPRAAAQVEKLPPDQRESQLATSAKRSLYFDYGRAVTRLIWFAIIAGILLGTFKFAAGAEVPFKIALGIVTYASLPMVLRHVLAIAALLAGVSPDMFNPDVPLMTNIAYFVDPTKSLPLYSFAAGFDLFEIWTLVLAAIGFSSVAKLKRSTALIGVFAWYFVLVLISVGVAAIFS